jgi:hypothetical protein
VFSKDSLILLKTDQGKLSLIDVVGSAAGYDYDRAAE